MNEQLPVALDVSDGQGVEEVTVVFLNMLTVVREVDGY